MATTTSVELPTRPDPARGPDDRVAVAARQAFWLLRIGFTVAHSFPMKFLTLGFF